MRSCAYPALRGSRGCLFSITGDRHNPGFQERLHQRADTPVLDPHPQAVQQGRVINLVETGLDVRLQHPFIVPGAGGEEMDLRDRIMCTPVRAEPIRARLEVRLENGLENRFQAGLDHPVSDGGDTEATQFPARLWNLHLPHLDRTELTRLQ